MTEPFIAFCEELWQRWLKDASTLEVSPFVRRAFDLDAAPEPYLYFSAGAKPLVALTTNPGATMCHQCRAAVQAGSGPLKTTLDYAKAAEVLGDYYVKHLKGPASDRIAKLGKLSSRVRHDGVMQVEACPFHSASLPAKRALLKEFDKGGFLGSYAKHLGAFLKPLPVVSPQAAPTGASLGPETARRYEWLRWLGQVAALDLKPDKFVSLVEKGSKTTVAAWVSSQNGVPKALVLRMGAPGLPADNGLRRLAEKLRELCK